MGRPALHTIMNKHTMIQLQQKKVDKLPFRSKVTPPMMPSTSRSDFTLTGHGPQATGHRQQRKIDTIDTTFRRKKEESKELAPVRNHQRPKKIQNHMLVPAA